MAAVRRLASCSRAAVVLVLLLGGCDSSSDAPIRSLKDMKGRTLAILSGSAFRESTECLQDGIRYVSFNDISSEMLALKDGKVDGVAIDEPVARYCVAQSDGLFRIAEVYTQDRYAFVFKKDSPLAKEVSAVVSRLKADGTMKRLVDKWCDASLPNPPFDPLPADSQHDGSRGQLRVVVAPELEPSAYYANRQIIGFEPEILRRIAWELNCTVEFLPTSFGALIEAVSSGKADIATGLIIVTPARERAVSFSAPYHTGGIVLLVRDRGDAGILSLSSLKTSLVRTFAEEARWRDILEGLGRTLLITLCAVLMGSLLAFPVWRLRISRSRLLRAVGTTYVAIFQGTPVLVVLMILYYVVFATSDISGEAVAVIGFGLNLAAYAGEMLRAGVAAVPAGQREAALALGFTPFAAFRHVVFPQALANILPVYRGEVIGLLKSTSIVGYISVVDLTKVSDLIRARTYEAFFPLLATALIYFVIAWLITFALGRAERRLQTPRVGRRKGGRP